MKAARVTKRLASAAFLLMGAVLAGSLVPDAVRAQGLIVDHTCTDISKVPASWVQQAKTQFRIGYGHTSHGSQIVTGIATLRNTLGSSYDYTASSSGLVPGKFLNDYWAPGDLGANGDLTWRDSTLEMLNQPGNDRNVVMWSWCGGVSGNTAGGIDVYLQAMNELEQMCPDIDFIYMTGHLDGSGVSGNLNRMNDLIRQYCRANNKTLFDFADIESYDPDGKEFLSRYADDGCNYNGGNWADEWGAAHPGDARCAACDCAHSQPLNCNLKGRAFWWMMARLAGWSGSGGGVPAPRGVAASDGAFSNMVQVTWSAVIGASSYQVWRNLEADSSSAAQVGSGAAIGFDDTSVVPGAIYYYWIKAVNGSNQSVFSASDAGYAGHLGSSRQMAADFDGDAKADPAIYQETTGAWHIWLSSAGYARADMAGKGGVGYRAAAADFDGDSKADLAAFQAGAWTIWLSGANYYGVGPIRLGGASGVPAPADFDGDAKADPAVYLDGQWTIWLSSANYYGVGPLGFGAVGDEPVPADFDGDAKADPAVYKEGQWTIWLSGVNYRPIGPLSFGDAGAMPVPGDYDGDMLADPAVYHAAGDNWIVWLSSLRYGIAGPISFK